MVNAKPLSEYPDVIDVEQMREILGIGRNLAYKLLLERKVIGKKLGHNWIIAKSNLVKYILSEDTDENRTNN